MVKLFSSIAMFCFFSINLIAQQAIYYDFSNTLDEQNNLVPALNVLGTGGFLDESLPDLSCLERPVYGFTQNSGLQFDNGTAGFFTTSYTIEMYFKFTENTGFLRLMDFRNRTSDFGLYATSTELSFYDELAVNTNAFALNQYVHLVLSRDGVSEDVKMYLNGALVGTFYDADSSAIPDGSNVINFFQDDLVFGGEARPGNIALLRMYDYAIGDSSVAENFNQLESSSGVIAFSSDVQSACLNGNAFNFTNESNNSSLPAYTWEFGDGNSFAGNDATYSYASDGNYTVLLIADDGAGCVDSVSTDVVVFPSPIVDLGPDFGFCPGEQVLLDAGQGYISYLWNDGSTDSTFITGTSGIYSVTVVDSNSCSASDTIEVFDNPDPAFSLGTDTTICFGSTIDLSAPLGMGSYVWNTGSIDQSITTGFSGVYAVEVTSLEGCVATDTVEITVNNDIVLTLGIDTVICDGQVATFDAGTGFIQYQWNTGSTLSSIDVSVAGLYSVTVTDSFGCTKVVSRNLFVNTAPVVDLGTDVTICGGSSLILDAGSGFSSYLWNDGSANQTLSVTTQGSYTVTVTDGIGCEGTDVISIATDPFITLGNDLNLCDGQVATLDPVSLYTTYLWNNGSTSPTLNVTISGIYTLTVTDINGCINSDEIQVSFNQQPIVELGAGIDICNGDSTVLDAGAGFVSYLWNDGSTSQSINVSVSGTYTVTVSDLGGCSGSDTVTVNILPLPIVDLGPDASICDGTASVLDAGIGMTSYLWNDGSTSQMLLIFAAGTYSVTITDASGCTSMDEVEITTLSNPVVTLANDTILCSGDSLLVDAGAGFSTYLWNDGSTTQSIYATAVGNYTVTITDANGCQNFDDIEVDFYAAIPVPTIIQIGNTLQSSAATGNQWYSVTTGLIPGATGETYDPLVEDTYYVIVTDSNGCQSEPSPDFIFIIDGIAQISGISFVVAPNPATDKVEIIFSNAASGKITLEILDLQGKLVHTETNETGSKMNIDVSKYQNGIYLIRMTFGNHSTHRKLIISH